MSEVEGLDMTKDTGNPQLIKFIRDTIRANGPVTFEWFMEQALYHPRHGYYTSGRAQIGRRGDFFTNVSVGAVFGELLARQFHEMWEALGRPEPFTIVEQGAHNADFAVDVLRFVSRRMPDFAAALRYCIVERFPAPRRSIDCRVRWCASLDELDPFSGVHFSNELLDAVPVHLVRRNAAGWHERYVAIENEQFVFVDGAPTLPAASLPDVPPPYETEINSRTSDWISPIAQKLTQGYVLAVDYGYPRAEYYAPHRSAGTLRCYAQHHVIDSPLSHVGEADITAHVDWTSVAEHAVANGLQLTGFTDQHHFLTGLVSAFPEDELADLNRNQLQTLLQPTMLGSTFQFLVLSKNAPAKLTGLKFARDPQIALGLRNGC
ncbi:MAG: class I SAM-dependent methyltransferase [Chthoniobacterales bacterium]